ncbi:MAG TPA: hypothetical protein VK906_02710, partial [Egicoccus sp.]|nr:hypothetical protein [Egicoccus sp.]
MTDTMRAVTQLAYGGPDVLRVTRVPIPRPGPGQVRVRVHATTVTPPDGAFRSATPAVTRLFTGLRRPRSVP